VESELEDNSVFSSELEFESWLKELESTPYEYPPRLATDEEVTELTPWRVSKRELALMTPAEREAALSHESAIAAKLSKENTITSSPDDWYRKWKTECMGYDYGYYDRIYGKDGE
jgi:hypothetical protein